jgi:hypothetical protein
LVGLLRLRDRRDAERLRSALRPGVSLVAIGGGFIGLEFASTRVISVLRSRSSSTRAGCSLSSRTRDSLTTFALLIAIEAFGSCSSDPAIYAMGDVARRQLSSIDGGG